MTEQPQLAVGGCCNSPVGRCGDLPYNQHCYCCPLHPATREMVKPRRSALQKIADHYRRLHPLWGYVYGVQLWEGKRAYWAGTVHCPTRADLPGCGSPRWQPAETRRLALWLSGSGQLGSSMVDFINPDSALYAAFRRLPLEHYLPAGFTVLECGGCGGRVPGRIDGDTVHVPEAGAAMHDGCAGALAESAPTSAERVAAAEPIREALMPTGYAPRTRAKPRPMRVVPRRSFPSVEPPDEMPGQTQLW